MDTLFKPMTDWFFGINLPLQIFYGIGILSGLALVVQLGLALLGLDHHDLDGDGGFFSIKAVTALMLGFGWSGVIAMRAGASPIVATGIGLGSGVVLMAMAAGVMRFLYSQQSSGNTQLHNAVGKTGVVYLTIPGGSQSGGQVQVAFQGRLETVNAITEAESALTSGTPIRVVDIIEPSTLVVAPLSRAS